MTKMTDFQQKMSAFVPEIQLSFDEPMSRHTSFRIGGNVEVMAFPKNKEELSMNLVVDVRFSDIKVLVKWTLNSFGKQQ